MADHEQTGLRAAPCHTLTHAVTGCTLTPTLSTPHPCNLSHTHTPPYSTPTHTHALTHTHTLTPHAHSLSLTHSPPHAHSFTHTLTPTFTLALTGAPGRGSRAHRCDWRGGDRRPCPWLSPGGQQLPVGWRSRCHLGSLGVNAVCAPGRRGGHTGLALNPPPTHGQSDPDSPLVCKVATGECPPRTRHWAGPGGCRGAWPCPSSCPQSRESSPPCQDQPRPCGTHAPARGPGPSLGTVLAQDTLVTPRGESVPSQGLAEGSRRPVQAPPPWGSVPRDRRWPGPRAARGAIRVRAVRGGTAVAGRAGGSGHVSPVGGEGGRALLGDRDLA